MRKNPNGHVIVSKEEQDDILKAQIIDDKQDENAQELLAADEEVRNSQESELSSLPSPSTEQHLIEVENLKWSIEYEKKLHQQTSQLLEDKVSAQIASLKELNEKVEKLNEIIEAQDKDKIDLQKTIDGLEEKIKVQ